MAEKIQIGTQRPIVKREMKKCSRWFVPFLTASTFALQSLQNRRFFSSLMSIHPAANLSAVPEINP